MRMLGLPSLSFHVHFFVPTRRETISFAGHLYILPAFVRILNKHEIFAIDLAFQYNLDSILDCEL